MRIPKTGVISDSVIRVPLYPITIRLILCEDVPDFIFRLSKQVINRYKCFILPNLDGEIGIDEDFMLVLNRNCYESDIVHETFHLAVRILRFVGVVLTPESEEAYTYLQEYLYKKIRVIQIKHKLNGN